LQGDAINIRQAAGLLLKNNLKSTYPLIHPQHIQYIKAEVLPCLGSPDFGVRTTVGTIVSVVMQQGTFQGWLEVLQALLQCLDSDEYNHVEGALGVLFKVQCSFSSYLEQHDDALLDLVLHDLTIHFFTSWILYL